MSLIADLPDDFFLRLYADELRGKPWQTVNNRLLVLSERAKAEKKVFQVIIVTPTDMPEVILHLITTHADEVLERPISGAPDKIIKKRGEL